MSDTPDRSEESDQDVATGLGSAARDEVDLPAPPHEKVTWVLAWGMGIIGAIIIIVWAGMILFIN